MSDKRDHQEVPFIPPNFTSGSLELRADQAGIAIYGTPEGLLKLADLCRKLAESSGSAASDHIHLEDYGLLSGISLPGAVAVFRRPATQAPLLVGSDMENSIRSFPWLSLAVGVTATAMALHFASQGYWQGVASNAVIAVILLGHAAYRLVRLGWPSTRPPQP